MTIQQARAATKYFGEGVKVRVWCYHGPGNWCVSIDRESSVEALDIDCLNRAIFNLHLRILEERTDLELWLDRDRIVAFNSVDEAKSCMVEIHKAIQFIRSVSTDSDWKDIPADLFDRFGKY